MTLLKKWKKTGLLDDQPENMKEELRAEAKTASDRDGSSFKF